MGPVPNMNFTGCAVLTQRYFARLIMGPAFGTALLGMSSFRIWHNSTFKNYNNILNLQGLFLFFQALSKYYYQLFRGAFP
jgi:hypothetical protein